MKATQQEVEKVAEILSKLDPGFIPEPIFHQITRLSTSAILEIVPFRINDSQVEIFLSRRDDNDPNWPSMLNTPGTVIRADDTIDAAYVRILEKEIGIDQRTELIYVMTHLHKVSRGNELAVVYYIDLSGQELKYGEFFEVDSLPSNVVDTQLDFISKSKERFLSPV